MILSYYIGCKNYGDGVVKNFLEILTECTIKAVSRIANKRYKFDHVLSVGSILAISTKYSTIWGSGFIDKNDLINKPKKILLVRGQLSCNKLLAMGINCPNKFGDPLFIAPLVYVPSKITTKYKYGIIPHYIDKSSKLIKTLVDFLGKDQVKILDIETAHNPMILINGLNECQTIISSSLHGVILGIAYKKDTIWIEFSKNVIGDGFKFNDFFSSIQIDNNLLACSVEDIVNMGQVDQFIIKRPSKEAMLKCGSDIISTCPYFIDEEVRTKRLIQWTNYVNSESDYVIKPKIVVTFTTFDRRKEYLAPVLNSISQQTVKPDEIHCYTELLYSDFPEKIQQLLKEFKVKLYPADKSLKGYKKLLYVLKKYWGNSNVILITVDDDWVYRKTLISELVELHQMHPNAVICDRGKAIFQDKSYDEWPTIKGEMTHPHKTMIYSGSGALFVPTMFRDSVFDEDEIRVCCPTADDLWWTVQSILADTPVLTLSNRFHNWNEEVKIPNNVTLYNSFNKNQNTSQWNKLVEYAKNRYNIDVYLKIDPAKTVSFVPQSRSESEFEFYQGLDSVGGDLIFLGKRTIEELKQLCLDMPDCVAFNSLGFFKSSLETRDEWKRSKYFGPTDGLFVNKARLALGKKPAPFNIFGSTDSVMFSGKKPLIQSYNCPTLDDMMVVMCFYNFARSYRTVQNLLIVRQYLTNASIPYCICELAYDKDAFYFEQSENTIQIKTNSLMFYKENLMNITEKHLPESYTKLCFIDADVLFSEPDWYDKLSVQLDKTEGVQVYSNRYNLSAEFEIDGPADLSCVLNSKSSPGLAWAVRRDWVKNYGIFDYCVIGGGDRVFSYSFANDRVLLANTRYNYLKVPLDKYIQQDIQRPGKAAPWTLFHLYHGSHQSRQYFSRDKLISEFLKKHKLESILDIVERRSNDGLLIWKDEYREELNAILLNYFTNRNDDQVYPSNKPNKPNNPNNSH